MKRTGKVILIIIAVILLLLAPLASVPIGLAACLLFCTGLAEKISDRISNRKKRKKQ